MDWTERSLKPASPEPSGLDDAWREIMQQALAGTLSPDQAIERVIDKLERSS